LSLLSLLQHFLRCRSFGLIKCELTMAAMDVRRSMVRMAAMGLGNRRRERKHDHDDRGSQNAHNSLLQHHRPIVARVRT
jgi:hypothetical protein